MDLDRQLKRYARDLGQVYAGAERALGRFSGVLVRLLEARYPWMESHGDRVAFWALRLNERLGSPLPGRELARAARLHDIGLLAFGEPLDPERLAGCRQHPAIAAEIIGEVDELAGIVPWIRHHRERWDGRGGPDGLAGEEIPLGARVLAVADFFDLNVGILRLSLGAARELLRQGGGGALDPELARVFAEMPLEVMLENYRWVESNEGSDH